MSESKWAVEVPCQSWQGKKTLFQKKKFEHKISMYVITKVKLKANIDLFQKIYSVFWCKSYFINILIWWSYCTDDFGINFTFLWNVYLLVNHLLILYFSSAFRFLIYYWVHGRCLTKTVYVICDWNAISLFL